MAMVILAFDFQLFIGARLNVTNIPAIPELSSLE